MVRQHFDHVAHWVFDLDNTLYPPEVRLFDQIEGRMTAFVMEALGVDRAEAGRLRHRYWQEYGTTLAGLMEVHGIAPERYLREVHEIDFSVLPPAPDLAARLAELPGRRVVYTNGSAPYAERVLAARGLEGLFDAVFGVEHAGFEPKPRRTAFERVFTAAGVETPRAAMFEDDPRNLAAPHAMGMRTVHVAPERHAAEHIHHHTDDLADFLAQVI